MLASVHRFVGLIPECVIAQSMSRGEGAGIQAAHAGKRRRITAGRGLSGSAGLSEGRMDPQQRRANRHCHAIQKIPPLDGAVHSKFTILGVHTGQSVSVGSAGKSPEISGTKEGDRALQMVDQAKPIRSRAA